MTTPLWCLFIVSLIPFVLAGVGGYHRTKQFGRVDNNEPREQAAKLEGAGARATAAQANAWEALALFTAAVSVNHFAGGDPGSAAIAAVVFVVARVLHPICYLADIATARSLVFLVGLGACISLFVQAARA